MFTCFLVIFFIKLTNQFFKNSPHSMIIQCRQLDCRHCIICINRFWAQVDGRRNKLFNNSTKNVCINHCINLITKLEFFQNFLNIRRKTIKICFKISFKCLFLCTTCQIFQQERRSITKRLICSIAQGRPLVCNTSLIHSIFHFKNVCFCIF